jgi:ribosomal-protein-alanine N-acetyltransferase
MMAQDVPAVLAIEERIFPHPWSEAIFREELALANRAYFLAEGDAVAGYAGLMVIGEDAHVTNIAVAPEARRHGVATRLLLCLIEEAQKRQAEHLTLEVRVSNREAQELYRRFGLAPVGIRRGYYNGEDALIMWAIDIGAPEYQERIDAIREGLA